MLIKITLLKLNQFILKPALNSSRSPHKVTVDTINVIKIKFLV